jgi:hypothetical protein
MAPLPPESTARYFMDYQVLLTNHTMEIRATGVHSPAALGTFMGTLLTTLAPLVYTITVQGFRFATLGSTVSNPVVTGIEGNTYGTGVSSSDSVPLCMNFVGRSPLGRRVRAMLFGYKSSISTYRLTGAESAPIATATSQLNGSTTLFQAIDGGDPVWKEYVNIMYNAYWQRAVRA